jgi:hypothetical protein
VSSETNPVDSGLQDTISGSKELRDDDLEGDTNSKKPKGTHKNPTPTT